MAEGRSATNKALLALLGDGTGPIHATRFPSGEIATCVKRRTVPWACAVVAKANAHARKRNRADVLTRITMGSARVVPAKLSLSQLDARRELRANN